MANQTITSKNLDTEISEIRKRAIMASVKGHVFHFPNAKDLIGEPPVIPCKGEIKHTFEAAENLSSYYETAAYIEAKFSEICKEIGKGA